MKKTIIFGWGRIVFGLLIFALGVHLTIRANLGLAPWDCLGMGIAAHTPLNYGLSMTIIAVIFALYVMFIRISLSSIGMGSP